MSSNVRPAAGAKPKPVARLIDYRLVDITVTQHVERIISAASRGAAMLHASRTRYTIEPLSNDDAYRLGIAGVKKEIAIVGKDNAHPTQLPLTGTKIAENIGGDGAAGTDSGESTT